MNDRTKKRIGVFVSHIFGRYQTELCRGIMEQSRQSGYSVDIFVSADGEDFGNYGLGERSILRIPSFNNFSGIVFASGTYLLPELCKQILEVLRQRCHCPVIEINLSSAYFPVINLDNQSPVALLIEHLITVHHCQRICFLGNRPEKKFSDLRLDLFHETMKRHGLCVTEKDIAEADYSEASVAAAVSFFLNTDIRPDAIVCYNDTMALLTMKVLLAKGMKIPDDIRLTGCDELESGQKIAPALTTVTFPLYEVGETAVRLILDARKQAFVPPVTSLAAEPRFGGTCGCRNQNVSLPVLHTCELIEQIQNLEGSMLNNIKLSAQLQRVTDLEEGMELIEKYVSGFTGIKEFYLCLYSDWERILPRHPFLAAAQETIPPDSKVSGTRLLKFACKDGKRLPECSFTGNNELPDYIYRTPGAAYIFTPLYFGSQEFGYTAVSYETDLSYQLSFLTWMTTISRMLKSICDDRYLMRLAAELESGSARDPITGFYNREGFRLAAGGLVSEAAEARKPLFLSVLELQDYQKINRLYGHAEGDFALRVLGHAIENALPEEAFCAHPDGAEFYLLADGITEEAALVLQQKVRCYLEHYNLLHTRPYPVTVRIGFTFLFVEADTELTDLFDAAANSLPDVSAGDLQ